MQINYYNNFSHQHIKSFNNPTFSSWKRTVFKSGIKHDPAIKSIMTVKYCNDTCFYRKDLNWQELVKFLINKYKDIPKVNIYNYACSNGSETYTLLSELIAQCGENKKFLPIIAKDIDPLAIKYAKEGPIPITTEEECTLNWCLNDYFKDCFQEITIDKSFVKDETSASEQKFYKPTNMLTKHVEFSIADIFKDYKNIEPDNSVVFVRNFWPYLNGDKQVKLAKNLYKQLGNNSLIVLGDYDFVSPFDCIDIILESVGFQKTEIKNVYTKNNSIFYRIKNLLNIFNGL